jgi:serine/threonine protein kinase/formylglycine-generating enzyme required for sulfatase activity
MPAYLRCPNPNCPASAAGTRFESDRRGPCPHCGRELEAAPADASDGAWPQTLVPDSEDSGTLAPDSKVWSSLSSTIRSSHPWEPDVGSTFAGRYTIVRALGRGGMGAVYLAHDDDLDRDVALKIPSLEGDTESFLKRFQREARAGAQLGHNRNFCRVIDVGHFEDLPYLTMEYIQGRALSEVLVEHPGGMPPRDAVQLVITLSNALGEAHARGIVHRDLKPSNVMIRDDGSPVLMDFGLARRETDERITTRVMGTPAYMSPEQALADFKAIGPASDLYSLGVILYELLTGQTPFSASSARQMLRRIVNEEPTPPSAHRPDLDPRLDAICRKAMAKAPADRYPTMAVFAQELERFSTGAVSPGKTTDGPGSSPHPPGKPGPSSRRSRRLAIAATSAVVVGTGVFFGRHLLPDASTSGKPPAQPSNSVPRPPAPPAPATSGTIAPEPASPEHRPPVTAKADSPDPGRRINPVSAFTGMTFVLIKPGEFTMGSPADEGEADEHPPHRVLIRHPFLLGRFEVTQAEYLKVTGQSPSYYKGNGALPVEQVSWLDAVRFCNTLSEKDGLEPFYKIEGNTVTVPDWRGTGYRLPTEAEWEYACRAGQPGRFGFDDDEKDLGDYAWYHENSRSTGSNATQAVGGKKENAFHLHDLQGNVWEWCWDWYAEKYGPEAVSEDPTGPASGRLRVIRGGTHNNRAAFLRCASRGQDEPASKTRYNGFRVARSVPEEPDVATSR